RGLVLGVGQLQAALDLGADVLAVEVRVLGVELAVDVCHLSPEDAPDAFWLREVDRAAAREARRGLLDARTDERVGVLDPGDADGELLERLQPSRLEPRDERAHHLLELSDGPRHRAGVVEARREREAAV